MNIFFLVSVVTQHSRASSVGSHLDRWFPQLLPEPHRLQRHRPPHASQLRRRQRNQTNLHHQFLPPHSPQPRHFHQRLRNGSRCIRRFTVQ